MDGYEWDEEKNAKNLSKHGISFEEAATIFDGPVLSVRDEDSLVEMRDRSFGLIGGIVVACVIHTQRSETTRIISARKATKTERKMFDEHLKKTYS